MICSYCGEQKPCLCPGQPKASKQHKEAMKYIYDLSEVSMCCVHPPGDGSTCAGGICECKEDYECDKCKQVKGR